MTMFEIGTELENIKVALNSSDDLLSIFEELLMRDFEDMEGGGRFRGIYAEALRAGEIHT